MPVPYRPDPAMPDLTTFYVIHRGMRRDSARLASALFAASRTDTTNPALAEWTRRFVGEIHAHHHVEDTVFFPAVAAAEPASRAILERLDLDHETLADTLDQLLAAVDGRIAGDRALDALRPAEDLCELLHNHLRAEDEELLPLIHARLSRGHFAELERDARRATPSSTLSFTVPWVMSHADDSERRHLLSVAGIPLRVLWWATRRRFDRLASAAFADAVRRGERVSAARA